MCTEDKKGGTHTQIHKPINKLDNLFFQIQAIMVRFGIIASVAFQTFIVGTKINLIKVDECNNIFVFNQYSFCSHDGHDDCPMAVLSTFYQN